VFILRSVNGFAGLLEGIGHPICSLLKKICSDSHHPDIILFTAVQSAPMTAGIEIS
jgi:hypothetical protein